jgi:hypothetical protein
VVTPTTTTTYTVWGTDANGCKGIATSVVTVQNCATGITSYAANEISVYPNPANEFLTVSFGSLEGKKSIAVYDVSGRLVIEKNADADTVQLNVLEITKGSYFIKVLNDKVVVSVKMIMIVR